MSTIDWKSELKKMGFGDESVFSQFLETEVNDGESQSISGKR